MAVLDWTEIPMFISVGSYDSFLSRFLFAIISVNIMMFGALLGDELHSKTITQLAIFYGAMFAISRQDIMKYVAHNGLQFSIPDEPEYSITIISPTVPNYCAKFRSILSGNWACEGDEVVS